MINTEMCLFHKEVGDMKKLFRSIAAALIVATLTIAVVTVVPDSTAIQAEAISLKDVIKLLSIPSGFLLTFKSRPFA